jgi:hypothetical protein
MLQDRASLAWELNVRMSRFLFMPGRDNLDRIWAIIERVGVCMLTSQGARGLRARPLEARPDRSSRLSAVPKSMKSRRTTKSDSFSSMKLRTHTCLSPLPPRRCAIVRSLLLSGGPPTICGGTDLMTRMLDSCGSLRGLRSYGTGRQARRWRCSSFSNRRLLARSLISARNARRR